MRFLLIATLALLTPLAAQETHMVVEAYSGKILSAKGAAERRPVASLTKLATAIVAVDWAEATGNKLSEYLVEVPSIVTTLPTKSPNGLVPGDTLTLREALYAALLTSDNVAALTIAYQVGGEIMKGRGKGGDPAFVFVDEMNKLTKSIAAKDTLFVNSHGLERGPKAGYSTAADMARLSIHAMRRNAINFIVKQKTRQIDIIGPSGQRKVNLTNSNKLIGETGIIGVKTGTTSAAGPCLATCMDRDPVVRTKADGSKGVTPRRLVTVVLNSPDRYGRTRALLRDGWKFYDAWLAAGAPVDGKHKVLETPAK